MAELRKGFHGDLDAARAELVRLAASVTETIPRATAVLLEGDLEGADYIIQGDVEIDAAKAAAIDDMDSYLDGLQKQFVQAIFESHAAGRIDLQVAVQLAVVARFYERIGDHAVNVGERVRFVITGWLPEHHGAQR